MRITIIGLGLIGGSIGMALKQSRGSEIEIVGFARRPEVAARAVALEAVDRTEDTLRGSVKGSHLVIVSTPVRTMEAVLKSIASYTMRDCLVTDTGSTKEQVMAWARQYLCPRGIDFVGGHPMAGKERQGIDAADPNMLEDCAYCISPAEWARPESTALMEQVVSWLGAKPLHIGPRQHDFLVAGISHLPALISAAIADVTTRSPEWPMMARLAATGYRDMTRLASGSPKVNSDIFSTNRPAMLLWIDQFCQVMGELRERISAGDDELENFLGRACKAREDWVEQKIKMKSLP